MLKYFSVSYMIVGKIMRQVLGGLKSLWTCVTDNPQITWLEEHSGKTGSHKNKIFVWLHLHVQVYRTWQERNKKAITFPEEIATISW